MKQKIINHIQQYGPINVAEYMAFCLYDPQEGYYTTRTPLGPGGDFITAPELTPLFGEMLGLWVAATWHSMGAPNPFSLVEFGPGRGLLFADMLRAIAQAAPQCLAACQGHLVEISPKLTQAQKHTLAGSPAPLKWHKTLKTLPNKNPAILIGNEFLDAFPVRQYARTHSGAYKERLITTSGTDLLFTLSPQETPLPPPIPNTEIIEKSPEMEAFLQNLKQHFTHKVALLLLDYGTATTPEGVGDTLQALRNHKQEGIFAAPGEADLTWHIPFREVCGILGEEQCMTTDLALFLVEIGFPLRAEQAHRAAQTSDQKQYIEETTNRLLSPNHMGRHFKVFSWSQGGVPPLAGFIHCAQTQK